MQNIHFRKVRYDINLFGYFVTLDNNFLSMPVVCDLLMNLSSKIVINYFFIDEVFGLGSVIAVQ